MKNNLTPLVDDHLMSLQNISEPVTSPFFYEQLKRRMEKKVPQAGWQLPLRPVWIVGTLVLLLIGNGWMLAKHFQSDPVIKTASSPLENFAASYDQAITFSY